MSKIRLGTTNLNFKTKMDVGRVFAPVVVVASVTNLIPNGDFSINSKVGWVGVNANNPTLIAGGYTAPYELKSGNDNSTSIRDVNYSATIPAVTIGQRYSFSFWVKSPGAGSGLVMDLYLGTTNFSATPITIAAANVWQKVTVADKLWAGNQTFNFSLTYPYTDFSIDDVYLVAGSTAY